VERKLLNKTGAGAMVVVAVVVVVVVVVVVTPCWLFRLV
jgi:hypothetical protein